MATTVSDSLTNSLLNTYSAVDSAGLKNVNSFLGNLFMTRK